MLPLFLLLLVSHFVADFVCQTHWQATNKSKNNAALLEHVATYTVVMALTSWFISPLFPRLGESRDLLATCLLFSFGNGALHFGTDYVTSRISSKLYAKKDFHNFFVVIGFDQLIHQVTLAGTMYLAFYR